METERHLRQVEAQRRYRAKNRDLIAQKAREYRATSTGKEATSAATKKQREKNPDYRKEWVKANPDKHKAIQARYHEKNPLARRAEKLKARYGITPEQYDVMLAAQGGHCACCPAVPGKKPLFVDHNHRTGAVRGLLCHGCNVALGAIAEDVERTLELVAYLWRYS